MNPLLGVPLAALILVAVAGCGSTHQVKPPAVAARVPAAFEPVFIPKTRTEVGRFRHDGNSFTASIETDGKRSRIGFYATSGNAIDAVYFSADAARARELTVLLAAALRAGSIEPTDSISRKQTVIGRWAGEGSGTISIDTVQTGLAMQVHIYIRGPYGVNSVLFLGSAAELRGIPELLQAALDQLSSPAA